MLLLLLTKRKKKSNSISSLGKGISKTYILTSHCYSGTAVYWSNSLSHYRPKLIVNVYPPSVSFLFFYPSFAASIWSSEICLILLPAEHEYYFLFRILPALFTLLLYISFHTTTTKHATNCWRRSFQSAAPEEKQVKGNFNLK